MASGIAIHDKCVEAYNALSKREYSTIVLKINDEMTEVSVEKTVPALAPNDDPEALWKTVVSGLPENGCRYVITDFSWKETPTVTKSKIIMVLWSADLSPTRHKMIYASSKEGVASKMAVQKSIQATELDEIDYATLKSTVTK